VTHEDTIEEETEAGFGRRLLRTPSILETQDGQWRFDNKNEVVSIIVIRYSG
jgi:hypothetical protein